MRIDQPWNEELTVQVDDAGARRIAAIAGWNDCGDVAVAHDHRHLRLRRAAGSVDDCRVGQREDRVVRLRGQCVAKTRGHQGRDREERRSVIQSMRHVRIR